MKKGLSANEATFSPQFYKSFPGALYAFFEHQLPNVGGDIIRQELVNHIYQMVCKFFPETTHLKPGQTPWVTVAKSEKASYGKSMKQTDMVPVIIELIGENDVQDRAQGKKLKEIKVEAVARICKSVDKQQGCITQAELAILLKTSTQTISKYISEWEIKHNIVLPRRGTIHDLGPTLTHKKIIIHKLFIDKLTVQETSRQTYHSYQAIFRYISAFKRVLMSYRKGLTIDETAHVLQCGKRLVKQYIDIIEEYKNKGYILDEIQQFDATVAAHYEEHPLNCKLPSEILGKGGLKEMK